MKTQIKLMTMMVVLLLTSCAHSPVTREPETANETKKEFKTRPASHRL